MSKKRPEEDKKRPEPEPKKEKGPKTPDGWCAWYEWLRHASRRNAEAKVAENKAKEEMTTIMSEYEDNALDETHNALDETHAIPIRAPTYDVRWRHEEMGMIHTGTFASYEDALSFYDHLTKMRTLEVSLCENSQEEIKYFDRHVVPLT